MTSQNENKKVGTNPIITSIYTADPAPMVSGDTLYLYTTHDEDQLINDFYTMNDWRCYSTKDMVNWEDHGAVFSLDDISWAQDRAWAPQAIERNGKFYLYCPVHKKDGGMATGLSEYPTALSVRLRIWDIPLLTNLTGTISTPPFSLTTTVRHIFISEIPSFAMFC